MDRRKVLIESTEGNAYEMDVPKPAPNRESTFVFALHKSGSVLLDNIVQELCGLAHVPTISIDGFCFNKGLPIEKIMASSVESLLNSPGYCFSGFRGVHSFLRNVDLQNHRKIVLVRDPRDILTSLYFSMTQSHTIPKEGEVRDRMIAIRARANNIAIDDYVLSAQVRYIETNFRRFMALQSESTKLYRYEDVIFEKLEWIKSIITWFSLNVREDEIGRIAKKHDIRPGNEDPSRHIRQVAPGNHKKHLSEKTIRRLNAQFEDIMEYFGYNL